MRWLLYLGSFVLGCVLMYVFMPKPPTVSKEDPVSPPNTPTEQPKVTEQPKAAKNDFPSDQYAENYVAPKDLSIEMQAFEKGVRYLAKMQEPDGHWSAKNSGAAPEFQNTNGDIAITALATYSLLLSARGKVLNKPLMARAKLGLDWLLAKIQPNGAISAANEPGDPVVAHMLACLTLMQSTTMSTREDWKKAGIQAVRHAVLEMMSPEGGWGSTPKATELRAETTTLGVFVYRAARLEEIRFSDNPDRNANVQLEVQLEKKIKAGLSRLLIRPPVEPAPGEAAKAASEEKPHPDDGVYAAVSTQKTGDWHASVGGLLAQIQMLVPPSKTLPTVKYVYGDFDKNTSRFPLIQQKMAWGEKGENVRAISLWFNTVSTMYLFGEQTFEHRTWNEICKKIVLEKQRPDGGWDVAGEDAKRGAIWRAALLSLTATLIAPPPQPQQPDELPK